MAFSFALSCLRSYVLLRCNCMQVYLATNNDNDELVYIGKSKNLINRIASSIQEKKATKYRYALLESDADMNIYEIYYISKYKPKLNIDCVPQKNLTVTLPNIQLCDLKSAFK